MPLRAIFNGQNLQSFSMSNEEWADLKETYKKNSLTMFCCGQKAIPKTSKLGTKYFSHAKRDGCEQPNEIADHLRLKTMVAEIAESAGWEVTTESLGKTTDGEKWVANILCRKGKVALVFEIQWSFQNIDEYERITKKYLDSGINRVAWLYRLPKRYDEYDLFQKRIRDKTELPMFGFTPTDDNYHVPQFDLKLSELVKGMFGGELKWRPAIGEKLIGYARYNQTHCLKCGGPNNYFTGIALYTEHGALIHQAEYWNSSASLVFEWLISKKEMQERMIGSTVHIYNKSGNYAYMAHGCLHCTGVQCNHTGRYEYPTDNKQAIRFEFTYDPDLYYVPPKWCLKDRFGPIHYGED